MAKMNLIEYCGEMNCTTMTNWNVPVMDLPRISHINRLPLPLVERFSTTTKNQYRFVYCGRSLLFIGDASIRTMYFDLCKMLSVGLLLDYTQSGSQSGLGVTIEGDVILLNSGTIGSDQYMDIRYFSLPESVIDIYFVFIPTVFNDKIEQCLNFLTTMPNRPSFDVIITSCYLSDMNQRKLAERGLVKQLHFDQFGKGLKECLNRLRKMKRFSCLKKTTKLFWLTPTPQSLKMSDTAMKSFLEISQMTDEIAEKEHFEIIDRLEAWMKADQELVTKETGHFSQYGVRTINDILLNKISQMFNRIYHEEEVIKKRPVDQFTKSAAAAGWFSTKPARMRSVPMRPSKRLRF